RRGCRRAPFRQPVDDRARRPRHGWRGRRSPPLRRDGRGMTTADPTDPAAPALRSSAPPYAFRGASECDQRCATRAADRAGCRSGPWAGILVRDGSAQRGAAFLLDLEYSEVVATSRSDVENGDRNAAISGAANEAES